MMINDTTEFSDDTFDALVYKAKDAQESLVVKDDKIIDQLLDEISCYVKNNLERLALEEVVATGLGDASHKKHKLSLVCYDVADLLQKEKTTGRLAERNHAEIVEYASPVGVIFAVVPMTNPIPNSLFKVLHALKTRNSIILSYPSKARALGVQFVDDLKIILDRLGFPPELIQTVPIKTTRDDVKKFMSHSGVDLVLATGGGELVKAAYSSGNPCFGVGPGNVSAVVMPDADIKKSAQMIIDSKAYDNGIICGSENNLVISDEVYDSFVEALELRGAAVLDSGESQRLQKILFDDNLRLKREFYGRPAKEIAALSGINRPYLIRLLIIPTVESQEWLAGEKLMPLLAMFRTSSMEAINLGYRLLIQGEGIGHTASIFTNDSDTIENFAENMPAGRLLVNTPATFGMMGASTHFPLSFMLGSGTWGNNIMTEAVTWRHFVNIKRLSKHAKDITY
jgi:acetaldehyde dehydrogenase (acetylating)